MGLYVIGRNLFVLVSQIGTP